MAVPQQDSSRFEALACDPQVLTKVDTEQLNVAPIADRDERQITLAAVNGGGYVLKRQSVDWHGRDCSVSPRVRQQ
jgi:hypothetical protein